MYPHELTTEEKARSILCRTGRPGNQVAALTEDEQKRLAEIYDECCAPEHKLEDRMQEFWGQRGERLAAAKATDDAQPGGGLFRNSNQQATPGDAAASSVDPPPAS